MNIYVVTEGEAESKIYKHWITYINPNIEYTDFIDKVDINKFYIVSGSGYPYYLGIIEDAISDVNEHEIFDRLVITVDSDEMTRDEKYLEIHDFISDKYCRVEIKIVVQNFCIETWGLANRSLIRKNPNLQRLRRYLGIFNVRERDPELLPANDEENVNRSQFAYKYLRAAFNDRYRNATYTKKNPKEFFNDSFFKQIKNRFEQTEHIRSFGDFLSAFI